MVCTYHASCILIHFSSPIHAAIALLKTKAVAKIVSETEAAKLCDTDNEEDSMY